METAESATGCLAGTDTCHREDIFAASSSIIVMFCGSIQYSVIVVINGSLTDPKNHVDIFTITKNEASWYGGIIHLVHLFGSLIAGLVQDSFGRKTCMLLGNVPQIIGWIILIYAKSSHHLYISSILMGLGASFSEIPVLAYISETISVELRGRLFSLTKIGYGIGALFVFFCNIYLHWRTLASICILAPIFSIGYLLMLPETPMWLLSRGREEDALKSLQWLRGWVPPSIVRSEFEKSQRYINESKKLRKDTSSYLPVSLDEGDTKKSKNEVWQNIKILSKKEFLQPYKLVSVLFLVSYILSLRVVKPYLLIILRKFDFHSPKILAISSFAQIIGAVTMAATVNRFGKKNLMFYSFNISAACLAIISLYGLLFTKYGFRADWLLYGVCLTIFYLTGLTIGGLPGFICGEIYPQQIRGLACGVSLSTAHAMLFILVKLYLGLESLLGISSLFLIYAAVGVIGTVYLQYQLPETENKSLEEIGRTFKNKDTEKDQAVVLTSLINGSSEKLRIQ
ncbi:hypothetical protein V9T40_003445 [Parthenolecanium corni]|uniref:Major facilitator superfamily (MFS) profile domain-containing protein n=1 Tax=Parthenolecanium corni TaxID=536013 RepID=A0AAN9TSJ3_9HEMI